MKKNKTYSDTTKRLFVFIVACLLAVTAAAPAFCEENWRASFNDLCSKVDASSSMTVQDLTILIERVDKLVPEIQASSDPSKKIFLQRIKKCRSLFEFMIESKKGSGQ
jgi:hypothetical protein